MEKTIRKAAKCFLIQENKVVAICYKSGNKKEGYYDIPGGKIEKGETAEQAAIREMKEETGIEVGNLERRGSLIIEYPTRELIFDIFITHTYQGEPKETEDNFSTWIDIEQLFQKEKILAGMVVLNRFFRKSLFEKNTNFRMKLVVDEQENIENLNYEKDEKR